MSELNSSAVVALPAPALRPFIARYAGYQVSGVSPGVHFGLPSSEVDLIISLGRPVDVMKMPNSKQQPSSFRMLVNGLQDSPAMVGLGGDECGLHVFIKPLGVRAVLGISGVEIRSVVVSLFDIWGNRAAELFETLLSAKTWRERFAALDRVFLTRLVPAIAPPEVAWAWEALSRTHGAVSVHGLAHKSGYSRRFFTERFREAVGAPPKSAARLFRFERACRFIAEKRGTLAAVAVSCGYYDQAHLTREWSALAGCSPKAWIARDLPFLQDYELGGRDTETHELKSMHQSFV
jgi:AraC-like DNA-binding protein